MEINRKGEDFIREYHVNPMQPPSETHHLREKKTSPNPALANLPSPPQATQRCQNQDGRKKKLNGLTVT